MRLKPIILILFLSLISISVFAQSTIKRPVINALRITDPPDIDGVLDDQAWQKADIATGFRQKEPVYDTLVGFKTEVKIIYDDKAVYIGAIMYDNHPDSIKKELAVRDSDGKNADYFYIGFDTWNSKQDAYMFGVSASGIQLEQRALDETYDAVWGSAVKITDIGWVAELRIPYSALRFPATEVQDWGLQIVRSIRRNRETDQWSLEPLDTENNTMNYWGTLTGLKNINPPLRLSVLPYISGGVQYDSQANKSNEVLTYNYNGGMDLKWGLNESFTLDMILMPDFSQVQSDAIEKNLSPFEIVYDENRPFFNEGTDLFQKGNLFYSRRIGHLPINYYKAYGSLEKGEHMVSNPISSRLINAVKLSGRTSRGLGIGAFNAITGNTYAVCADSANRKRDILTDPVTNFNILVVDQNLPNNSSVYLINTNVTRPDNWRQADVIGGGFKLSEKSNTYRLKFDLSVSNVSEPVVESTEKDKESGLYYNIDFQKTKGNFRFSLYQISMDEKYDKNDLGVNHTNDWLDRGVTIGYNIFKPFSVFRYLYQSVNLFREVKKTNQENINTLITYRFNTTFVNYLTIWGNASYSPFDRYDYWESRTNKLWINPGYLQFSFGFSSDYRKILAFDGNLDYSKDFDETEWKYFEIEPIIRVSDKLKLSPEAEFQWGSNDKGFVRYTDTATYFGNRDIKTYTSAIRGEYMFNNKISLSLWLRHYWQQGEYKNFLLLTDDGHLSKETNYSGNHNYNYNYFNVDLVFGWEFSPGSLINIVWKNAIQQEDQLYNVRYFDNFNTMISSPQLNNLSVKVLYYLDYQMLRRKK